MNFEIILEKNDKWEEKNKIKIIKILINNNNINKLIILMIMNKMIKLKRSKIK